MLARAGRKKFPSPSIAREGKVLFHSNVLRQRAICAAVRTFGSNSAVLSSNNQDYSDPASFVTRALNLSTREEFDGLLFKYCGTNKSRVSSIVDEVVRQTKANKGSTNEALPLQRFLDACIDLRLPVAWDIIASISHDIDVLSTLNARNIFSAWAIACQDASAANKPNRPRTSQSAELRMASDNDRTRQLGLLAKIIAGTYIPPSKVADKSTWMVAIGKGLAESGVGIRRQSKFWIELLRSLRIHMKALAATDELTHDQLLILSEYTLRMYNGLRRSVPMEANPALATMATLGKVN